jgi:uncharacterized Zn finger protein (UPF0148 family)
MKEVMAKVFCEGCKWKGNRKTGQLVFCPKCGNCATFMTSNFEARRRGVMPQTEKSDNT